MIIPESSSDKAECINTCGFSSSALGTPSPPVTSGPAPSSSARRSRADRLPRSHTPRIARRVGCLGQRGFRAGRQRGKPCILKYGPLGHTVNLASRVEGGTKHFGIPFLITGATRNELPDEFETRRVCQVRVVGISGTVDLHECRSPPVESARLALRDGYEGALELYERGSFDEAARILAALTAEVGAADQPCQILSELIECAREQRPDPFDPVFHLQSK